MKKCRGSMTITMCLVFSILLSLLLSGIQLARTQAGRIQAMHAADTGIYSIFAQYDKDLLDSYDLFYLDAGYGSSQVNPSFIVRQMESFMKPTLKQVLPDVRFKVVQSPGMCFLRMKMHVLLWGRSPGLLKINLEHKPSLL